MREPGKFVGASGLSRYGVSLVDDIDVAASYSTRS